MEVYVLIHHWDTPDNEGCEVLGVYQEEAVDLARFRMKEEAEKVKSDYEYDDWDEDFTWYTENEIHLGFDPCSLFLNATIYCWELHKKTIIGQRIETKQLPALPQKRPGPADSRTAPTAQARQADLPNLPHAPAVPEPQLDVPGEDGGGVNG